MITSAERERHIEDDWQKGSKEIKVTEEHGIE